VSRLDLASELLFLAHQTSPSHRLPLLLAAAGELGTVRARTPRLDDLRTWLLALGAERAVV
jgi:hypothetical protein